MYSTAFNYNISTTDPYVFDLYFRAISRPLKTWKEETIEAAKYIANNTDRKIWVGLSGGIDSEVVCRAFLEANINIGVFIVEHTEGRNAHDIKYALEFCANNNIKDIHIEPLDSHWFFTEGYKKYVKQGFETGTAFRYHQLFLLEQIERLNGCAVLGGGELKFKSIDNKTSLTFNRGITNASQFSKVNNYWHVPHFYMSTPEIMAAYLEHEVIKYLTSEHTFYVSPVKNFISEKVIVYHQAWPDMIRRKKYDGFEKIRKLYKETSKLLKSEYAYENTKVVIDINTLRAQLGLAKL